MQGVLRANVVPSSGACVAALGALGVAGGWPRAARIAAHSPQPYAPRPQPAAHELCHEPACARLQPATVCVPGEWPRVVALLDDLSDWEVQLSWRGLWPPDPSPNN